MTARVAMGLVLLVAFGVAVLHPESCLRTPEAMVAFFGGRVPLPGDGWQGVFPWDVAPFKYRLMFHGLADGVATLSDWLSGAPALARYHAAVVVVSGFSFVAAGLALERLLAALGFSLAQRWLGLLVWLALPPVHHAYVYPTCTKEDFLACSLFFLGLLGLQKRSLGLVVVAGLLGVATRETLLLLPLIVLLHGVGSRAFRVAYLTACVSVTLAIRFALGVEHYGALGQGLYYNLAHPLASTLGLFLVLGFTWVPLLGLLLPGVPAALREAATPQQRRFFGLFVTAACALLCAQFVLGRMTEIRISLLLGVWPVALLLLLLRTLPRAAVLSPRLSLAPLGALFAVAALELSGFGNLLRESLNPSLVALSNKWWWLEAYAQLVCGAYLAACVLALRRRSALALVPNPRPS